MQKLEVLGPAITARIEEAYHETKSTKDCTRLKNGQFQAKLARCW